MVRVLTGGNEYLAQVELDKLVVEFKSEYGDLALERIDCDEAELERILEAVSSMPFLASKKMVVLKNLGANKQLAESIKLILEAVAESTELIIYEPSPDKRTSYYKTIIKLQGSVEFKELDERELARWLVSQSKEEGGEITYADAVYLIDRVGPDQRLIASELQKLTIYDPKISRGNIDLLTEPTPQSKIFELLDQAFAGNTKKALKLYDDQRAQKVEPAQIMGMLTWQLNAMALTIYAGDKTTSQIAKDAGLNPYVVDKSKRLTSSIGAAKFKQLIARAQEIDINSKTKNIDLDEALKYYILTIK